jgi:hypothetical protein
VEAKRICAERETANATAEAAAVAAAAAVAELLASSINGISLGGGGGSGKGGSDGGGGSVKCAGSGASDKMEKSRISFSLDVSAGGRAFYSSTSPLILIRDLS